MPTYTPIQSITLTESMSSVTISNIPQNYTDLIISIASSSTHTVNDDIQFRFNGDTGSNYSQVRLYTTNEISTGASDRQASSTYISGAWQPGTNSTSGSVGITYSQIFNYSSTTMNKTVFNTMDLYSFKAVVGKTCGVWRNTSAINSVTLFSQYGAKIAVGSIINVYGISPVAAQNAQAAGGTDIYYDSTYVYHVFKGSGTFTPNRALTVDYLVVAGGGGGGKSNTNEGYAGGGGAGGFRTATSQSLTANTSYAVTVGAGGPGTTTNTAIGSSGSSSSFSSFSTTGGGGGASGNSPGLFTGANGGSGGGSGGAYGPATGNAGGYSPVEGYAGGQGNGVSSTTGGGGGAGGAGVSGTASAAGIGGVGASTSISGGSVTGAGQLSSGTYYFAGGGGGTYYNNSGGAGGVGGGGAGAYGTAATSGTTNTGGGGGGSVGGNAVNGGNGGNGGSGIVIVRYAR